MARTIAIGHQDFEQVRKNGWFTLIRRISSRNGGTKGTIVTLLTRPRRFGKTLNMSMTEQFFSVDYAGRGDLFEGLSVWEDEKYRRLRGVSVLLSVCRCRKRRTLTRREKESV